VGANGSVGGLACLGRCWPGAPPGCAMGFDCVGIEGVATPDESAGWIRVEGDGTGVMLGVTLGDWATGVDPGSRGNCGIVGIDAMGVAM